MNVHLSAIERDSTIQCRATIDVATVNEYAERMTEGDEFPPIVLFAVNGKHWIGDGWHRLLAAEHIGALTIPAEVRDGGRVEALKYALGANAAHGHRRTNADKRRCVEIALREFPKLSSRAIAEMCGTGKDLVESSRQLAESASSTRTGLDGKERPAKQEKKKHKQAEDRRVGWIADDDDEQQPAPKPAAHQAPSNGIHFANIALINLKQITRDDTERNIAFSMIRRFLDDNQTAAH